MTTKFDTALRNSYYRYLKNQSIVLKWLLNDLLENLKYKSVLDIGGSVGLAKKYCIEFGLYSLGMDMKQMSALLEEYSLMSILKYIRPLTRYLDIKDLPINGKFVDIYGNLHDWIAGIRYSEYDKGQSF